MYCEQRQINYPDVFNRCMSPSNNPPSPTTTPQQQQRRWWWPRRHNVVRGGRLLVAGRPRSGSHHGRTWVRQLWRHFDAFVATRWNRPLSVQCLRTLPQNERHESAAGQAAPSIGNHLELFCAYTREKKTLSRTARRMTDGSNLLAACVGNVVFVSFHIYHLSRLVFWFVSNTKVVAIVRL